MLFLCIERYASQQVEVVDENDKVSGKVSVPGIFSSTLNDNDILPVFISKCHAYIYLKKLNMEKEFKVVAVNGIELDHYKVICENSREVGKKIELSVPIRIVISPVEKDNKIEFLYLNKLYELPDILLDWQARIEEVKDAVKDSYQSLVASNQWDDEKITKFSDELFASQQPSKGMISTLTQHIKKMFSKSEPTTQADDFDYNHLKENLSKNLGSTYVYILRDKKGNLYTSIQDGCRYLPVFVNKLDAVITSLFCKELGDYFEPIYLHSDKRYLTALRQQSKEGKVKFQVIFGYAMKMMPLGQKWVSFNPDSLRGPSMISFQYPIENIENGFDIADYLAHFDSDQDRDMAMYHLAETNLSSQEKLINVAAKIIPDMKTNIMYAAMNDKGIAPRMVFAG